MRKKSGVTGATKLSHIGGIAAIVLVGVMFGVYIVPALKAGSDSRDQLYDAVLYTATRHQRDPLLHQRAMIQQWGPKILGEPDLQKAAARADERVAIAPVTHSPLTIKPFVRTTSSKSPRSRTISTATAPPCPDAPPAPAIVVHVPLVSKVPLVKPMTVMAPMAVSTPAPSNGACAVPRFHSVVAGPDVHLTLQVGSGRHYAIACPGATIRKQGDSLGFSAGPDGGKQVVAQVVGDVLFLSGSGKLDVVTTTPTLDRLDVTGDSTVTCEGISNPHFRIVESGHSTVELNGHAEDFQLDLSGNSTLRGSYLTGKKLLAGVSGNSSMEFDGKFGFMVLHADSDSSLRAHGLVDHADLTTSTGSAMDCSDLKAQDVEVEASLGSAMKVFASKKLSASARDDSRVQYAGNPRTVTATPDQTSRIFF